MQTQLVLGEIENLLTFSGLVKNVQSVFDLLKNEGMNKTHLFVLCLMHKLIMGLDKTGGKGTGQKPEFLSLTEP